MRNLVTSGINDKLTHITTAQQRPTLRCKFIEAREQRMEILHRHMGERLVHRNKSEDYFA